MDESELLKALASSMANSGFRVDFALLAHFYVMLKSKPLVILSGPPGSGKSAVVQHLARILVKENLRQFQSMIGHAWWAGQAGNVALLTEAQTRLNTGKFMLLLDEAGRPGNSNQLYIACLNRISPAEADGFFSDIAFQIQHERLMRLPSYHFTHPVPYPRNLIVIGTMDSNWQSIDDYFRRSGSVISWCSEPGQISTAMPVPDSYADAQAVFLNSRVDDKQAAVAKLAALKIDVISATQSIHQTTELLHENGNHTHPVPLECVLIYLANAWSNDGRGLFADRHEDNLEMALDSFTAEEILRPNLTWITESDSLSGQLQEVLADSLPRAYAVLSKLI